MERFPLDLDRIRPHLRDTFNAIRDNGRRFHRGQDIPAPIGVPVLAPVSGHVVSGAPRDTENCGHGIIIDADSDGRRWTLCHFNAPAIIYTGEHVQAGEVVGVVGASGNATTRRGRQYPHLHISAAELTPTDRRLGIAQNIHPELVEALAADLGISTSPSSPRVAAPLSARAASSSSSSSSFGGAWLALALIWYVRHERQNRGARAHG